MNLRNHINRRRAGIAAALALFALAAWWAFVTGHERTSLAGHWILNLPPDTRISLELRTDGTASQIIERADIPSPQTRQFRWFVEDEYMYAYATDPLPWWCADWMFETYLTHSTDVSQRATIVSVTADQLTLAGDGSRDPLTYRRAKD